MLLKKMCFCVFALLLALVFVAPVPAASKKAAPAENAAVVQSKLDTFAKSHVARANETLRPNRKFVEVLQKDGQYVAWFSEVDPSSLTTELHASNTPGCQYVGHVIYQETVYTCTGKTKLEAQGGEFKPSKVRRIRELTRYDKGKWCY